jgi:hypothetical protein
MSAVTAHIFIVVPALFGKCQEVSGKQTNHGMLHFESPGLRHQKRMPTIARILMHAVARGNGMNTMAQQVTQVANLLCEFLSARIRIILPFEKQWMATLEAHVFVMAGTLGDPGVTMSKDEAGGGVGDTRFFMRPEIGHAAVAVLFRKADSVEYMVAHLMAEQCAR